MDVVRMGCVARRSTRRIASTARREHHIAASVGPIGHSPVAVREIAIIWGTLDYAIEREMLDDSKFFLIRVCASLSSRFRCSSHPRFYRPMILGRPGRDGPPDNEKRAPSRRPLYTQTPEKFMLPADATACFREGRCRQRPDRVARFRFYAA